MKSKKTVSGSSQPSKPNENANEVTTIQSNLIDNDQQKDDKKDDIDIEKDGK